MNIMKNYTKAVQELYDHVGFTPDWVLCPIDDCTKCYWDVDDDSCKYAETVEKFNSDGDYYLDDIYTQRFYKKWVYEGDEFTMVMCNPGVDGVKWFRVFSNEKRITGTM